MKEELITKFMEKLLTYVQNTEVFLNGEIPKYIEELLNFKFYEHLIDYFFPFVLIIPGIFIVFFLYYRYLIVKDDNGKSRYDKAYDQIEIKILLIFSTLIVGSMTAFSIIDYSHLINAAKIKTAPRVYIIEYLKENIK